MAEDNFYRNTWIGAGAKYGGQLIGAGYDSSDGAVFNVAHPGWCFEFEITNLRLGPGLGGGVGSMIVIAFNTTNIYNLSGTNIEDWGFNFALAGKWSAIAKSLANIQKYAALAKLAKSATATKNFVKDAEGLKMATNYLWNAFDMNKRGGKPTIFTLDLPAGVGLEVSLVKTYGTFNIL